MEQILGKRVVIAGASSGVGKATAILLASAGAQVFLIARRESLLNEIVKEITSNGGKAFAYVADISDFLQVESAFQDVKVKIGQVDVLINCAAIPANNIFNTPPEVWRSVLEINLLGSMYCCRKAIDDMRANNISGQIINVGSLCIAVKDNGCDLYVASKAGIEGFTDSLRKEVSGDNIVVTLLNPGQIASDMVTETKAQKEEAVTLNVMLEPNDVAEAVIFCMSQPSRVAVTELSIRPRGQLHL
jgi:NADP-dependent 3-hydroxy acid dehydrogenase YdfG